MSNMITVLFLGFVLVAFPIFIQPKLERRFLRSLERRADAGGFVDDYREKLEKVDQHIADGISLGRPSPSRSDYIEIAHNAFLEARRYHQYGH